MGLHVEQINDLPFLRRSFSGLYCFCHLHVQKIEILRKLSDKDESKREKYENIDDNTKEVEIKENGEVAETDNDKLFADAANDAPPPQDAMTTTTAAASNECGDDNNVVT